MDCDSVTQLDFLGQYPYMHLVSLQCLPVSSIPTLLENFFMHIHLRVYQIHTSAVTIIILSCLEKSRCSQAGNLCMGGGYTYQKIYIKMAAVQVAVC